LVISCHVIPIKVQILRIRGFPEAVSSSISDINPHIFLIEYIASSDALDRFLKGSEPWKSGKDKCIRIGETNVYSTTHSKPTLGKCGNEA
jgi:hypothetical protein